jgi:hypothetical protein
LYAPLRHPEPSPSAPPPTPMSRCPPPARPTWPATTCMPAPVFMPNPEATPASVTPTPPATAELAVPVCARVYGACECVGECMCVYECVRECVNASPGNCLSAPSVFFYMYFIPTSFFPSLFLVSISSSPASLPHPPSPPSFSFLRFSAPTYQVRRRPYRRLYRRPLSRSGTVRCAGGARRPSASSSGLHSPPSSTVMRKAMRRTVMMQRL